MCFSAEASFAAGTALLIVGAATVRRARVRSELPYAWIPVLFGIQQLLEGALWLTFPDRAPLLNTVLTHAYSFFSHVLWPIYVPLAALALSGAVARPGLGACGQRACQRHEKGAGDGMRLATEGYSSPLR